MIVNPILNREDIKQSSWIDKLLSLYGVTNVDMWKKAGREALQPPNMYPNIDKAIQFIHNNKDKVWGVVVDADSDGYCSATIAYCLLKQIGATVVPFFHEGKQHGVEPELIEKILNNSPKIEVLWLPDAGSNEVDGCQKLAEAKVGVLVTDHHEIITQNNYAIIVNNCMKTKGEVELNHNLSGTGVTAKVAEHYCSTYGLALPNTTTLVALSIISDSCSLLSQENRAYLNLAFGGINDD